MFLAVAFVGIAFWPLGLVAKVCAFLIVDLWCCLGCRRLFSLWLVYDCCVNISLNLVLLCELNQNLSSPPWWPLQNLKVCRTSGLG